MGNFIAPIILIILLIIIIQCNTIIRLKNKIKQSNSGIEVALTKRFDLIPNLIECIKGYCNYEEKVLNEITEQRENYYKNKDIGEGFNLSDKCTQLLALGERYPNLKASTQFIELQAALERTESQLSAARRLYNGDVTLYNTKIQTFPGNLFALLLNAKPAKLFEAEKDAKSNIDVRI